MPCRPVEGFTDYGVGVSVGVGCSVGVSVGGRMICVDVGVAVGVGGNCVGDGVNVGVAGGAVGVGRLRFSRMRLSTSAFLPISVRRRVTIPLGMPLKFQV